MSTRLAQRTLVQCPLPQAAQRLTQFFQAHGNADGSAAQLSLWVDARVPGLPTPLRLERTVIVTIHPAHERGEMVPKYTVAWAAAEPGPFPLFAGSLRVDASEDYDEFVLILEGSYEPPLGLFGAAFDAVIGSRIAALCGRNLLATIAGEIEAHYAADEARKAGVAVSTP